VPFNRRESLRLEINNENNEQTPGDIWTKDIRDAVANNLSFNSNAVAGAMLQAIQSRLPYYSSILISELPAIPSLPFSTSSSSSSISFIITSEEEDNNPKQRLVR
jgi:hypothetical protein